MSDPLPRRDFLARSAAFGWAAQGRGTGANSRVNVAVIGVGGRGAYLADRFEHYNTVRANACQIVGVCDLYAKRVEQARQRFNCPGTPDYREILARQDVDAVVVATPDHWHARVALDAIDKGKDVYLETPVCHTLDELRQLAEAVRASGRCVQIGCQSVSGSQWAKAHQAIRDGMIGRMLMCQGSFHRNSLEGEWNWKIDPAAGPDAAGENRLDWKTFVAPTRSARRPYDAGRFFRFRKYWDYSGGIATDLFFHALAGLSVGWTELQYPFSVVGSGGVYQFKDERETPDTFHLVAEYAKGFSVTLTSCLGNAEHTPALIRGHDATLILAENGRFELPAPYLTVKPERGVLNSEYKARWGEDAFKIPVESRDPLLAHIGNFLDCVRDRAGDRIAFSVEAAARAQVAATMAVQSYREGKMLFFDEKSFRVVDKAPKA
jgi:predicted dehydrogenase